KRSALSMWLLVGCALALVVGCREAPAPSPLPSPPATAWPGPDVTRFPSPAAAPSWTPTLPPKATPVVVPTTSVDQVVVRETEISVSGYVYEPYLKEGFDQERGVPYLWLDRSAYGQPSSQDTVLRSFKAVVLENRYLRLTILPELGGRLYECVFKPTGQNIFYRNQVLKPTPWGPLSRELNWWLAAGGMEWAFPVSEHGYGWGVPWSYSIELSGGQTKVVLRDTAEARLRASVEIGLAPGSAYFTVRPQLENPTSAEISYQFWTDALLTLGSASTSPNTDLAYPAESILIHSTGPESGLPEERSVISWPTWQGRDLSWYGNWEDWLGFFVPEPEYSFVGAYNHDTDLGVVRAFSKEEAPGVKLFGWGIGSPFAAEYTDDGSQYFEIWGGPNRTFWPEDDIVLRPGQRSAWTECWYAFQGIGGLDFANREAAISLRHAGGSIQVGLATSSSREGTLLLELGGGEIYRKQITVSPESPHVGAVPLPVEFTGETLVSCHFLDLTGQVIAGYDVPLGALGD
ncbi:MAG: DUF5107 domain-containing protein, partial [Anaerolineae bacterium]|nr:DUF5107 domain-containing protein [Anaerolineae bacterium]